MLTRLLVLWLLSETPLHGYRIKKILNEESLRFWFPIEAGSIYSVLKSLVQGQYVEIETVEREGQRPERTRYRITKAGRMHLQDLLRKAWSRPVRPPEPILLALAARSELDEREIARLIQERAKALERELEALERAARSAPAEGMVSLKRALLNAELEWARSLADTVIDKSEE